MAASSQRGGQTCRSTLRRQALVKFVNPTRRRMTAQCTRVSSRTLPGESHRNALVRLAVAAIQIISTTVNGDYLYQRLTDCKN